MNKKGFTLVELLVVIGIIAVLVAFGVTNFLGARERARDIKKKSELQQVKTALRLYYNDFNVYPGPVTTVINDIQGCGSATPPSASCASACSGQFAAGSSGCDNVYMKQLPPTTSYTWSYQRAASGDDFCMWATLDNKSDTEIANSQAKCGSVCSGVAPVTDYVVCAD